MTLRARSLVIALPLALLAGCGTSRLSDSDITRLCMLQVRCSSGTTQTTCELLIGAARDEANARSCSGSFGAAGRCFIRADSCSANVQCADEQSVLDECLDRRPMTTTDVGRVTNPDAGRLITIPDARIPMTGTEGEVRQSSGYLEVFHEGEWRGVCDDGFTMENANVVCRQLGMPATGEFTGSVRGTGEFWLDDVACSGLEREISECESSGWGVDNCGPTEHVLVTCLP